MINDSKVKPKAGWHYRYCSLCGKQIGRVSHLGGKYLGRIPHHLNNKKLIEGTLIGIFLGGLSASYFVHYIPAFLSAGVAMLAEVIEIKIWKITIDDNLLVPLIAGTVMWAILVL